MKLFERIFVKVHYKTKERFMEGARDINTTATELLKRFIDKFLNEPEETISFIFGDK